MSHNTEKKPLRKPGYHLEMMDGELLMFSPEEAQILYCNQTASLIWQLCDGERTAQEIVEMLIAAFPEAEERIWAEAPATLEKFRQHGVIEFVDG
ncbi:MAG: PqqD family peptide modification chaperone [Chloroflexi bacterium]|jgi:hypothetical protein|nr:PqqD family peptide modification chaperone [Chloroflexota bacterium]